MFNLRSLAVDSSGAVYAVDQYRILKFSGQTGALLHSYYPKDIPPTADAPFTPLGLAVDRHSGDVIACEDAATSLRHRCVRMNSLNEVVVNYTTTLPELGAAYVAQFSNGDVVFTDPYSRRVLRMDSSNRVVQVYNTTIDGVQLLPTGVAVDRNDSVYICSVNFGRQKSSVVVLDFQGSLLRMYDLSKVLYPYTIAVDSSGNMLLAGSCSGGGCATVKLAPNGSVVQRYPQSEGGVAVDGEGHVYVSSTFYFPDGLTEVRVLKLNSSTGQEVQHFVPPSPPVTTAAAVAVDAVGNAYVLYAGGIIKVIAPNNSVIFVYTVVYPSVVVRLYSAIAVDVHLSVYISVGLAGASGNGVLRVLKFAAFNNTASLFFSQKLYFSPATMAMAVDAASNLYVCDNGQSINKVHALSPNGTVWQTFTTGLRTPASVAVDSAGNVFVGDFSFPFIVKLSPDNRLLQQYTTGTSAPLAVLVARSGNVYFSQGNDRGPPMITKLSANGTQLMSFNSPAPGLRRPASLAFDGEENVWVADSPFDRVLVFASSEQKQESGHHRRSAASSAAS